MGKVCLASSLSDAAAWSTWTCANAKCRDINTQWDRHQPGDSESQGTHTSSCGSSGSQFWDIPDGFSRDWTPVIEVLVCTVHTHHCYLFLFPSLVHSLQSPLLLPGMQAHFRICFWRESRLSVSSHQNFDSCFLILIGVSKAGSFTSFLIVNMSFLFSDKFHFIISEHSTEAWTSQVFHKWCLFQMNGS